MAGQAGIGTVDGQSADALGPIAEGLRIALFSGNYNCVRDGANKALNRLVQFLLDHGAAVRVYSPTAPRPAFEPAGDLVSVPSFGIPTRSEYRIAPGLPRKIRDDIRRFAPTHFHLSAPDFLGTAAQDFARELGVPVIASLHTRFETYLEYYRLGFLSGWMRRRLDRFYGASDYILVPNRPIAEEFRAKGWGEKLRIWGRGVNRDIFTPARRDMAWRRAQGYEDHDAVVLFFGRLVVEKGLDTFEAVVTELRRRGDPVRPLVVGDGPAGDWFASLLPNTVFTGHLEGAELGRAIASADILVNPSVTEAFGNVNLEAMAAALAVVSADVGSAQALIDSGRTGILVPPRDVAAYADAVGRLMHDPAERRRLGDAALAASSEYNWPDVLASVVRTYRLASR
ncbi:MAG: glycosyltransferase family 4 protein [Allosphingosinicella sp.]|uniref:glycosyltransferase family 4 protein n=1 Tax=Allosphingosinicella sp. TaxID=2823234 RepID=UPI00394942C4